MELAEEPTSFDREMYLEILRTSPPLRRYVSRGDTPDQIDIEGPHQDADNAIFRSIRLAIGDGMPRFQPILGSAGLGKTHLYWTLKDREFSLKNGRYIAVYVPSPPAPVRVPLHFHACIVDEIGEEIFDSAVDMLITKIGEIKDESSGPLDYKYALQRLLAEYPGISTDVVKVLLRYRLDPDKRDLARRWLFGDALNQEEIEKLDVRTILEEDDVTFATIKLLLKGSRHPIVLFVDEMEGPYNTHGEEGERHFFEVTKRLYNEGRNVIIVTSCLSDIWERVYAIADQPTRSRMEEPVSLRAFTKEDVEEFIKASMSAYWNVQNIDPPPDLLFPLSASDIEEAFNHSGGVPREALRFIIPRIDEILFMQEAEPLEEQSDFVIKLTAPVIINAIATALEEAGKVKGVATQLLVAKGVADREATAILKLTQGEASRKVCIDVANVKDWNRSGGVAAYYSVKRLSDIIEKREADHAVIAVPEATSGAKYQAISEDMGASLTPLVFTEESARNLVENTTKGKTDSSELEEYRSIIDSMF